MDYERIEDILTGAANGDATAWRRLIDAYSGRIFGMIFRQCQDRELAEEITQLTFVKIVNKLPDYHERGKFEPWMFRIAMNGFRDEMRRRKRQAIPVAWHETPPESISYEGSAIREDEQPSFRIETAEQMSALREAVASLSEADQEVIHLRYTAGLGFQEIANTLGQPLGTVLARGHRALKKLREKLLATEQD